MDRAELETTSPISRDELYKLLEGTMPERLFSNVDFDQLLTDAVAAMVSPKPTVASPPPIPQSEKGKRRAERRAKQKSKQPFAHLAALLPPTPLPRTARGTRPPPLRAKTNSDSSLPEEKAAQTIADVRARLDAPEAQEFPVLSPQVVAQLSCEEISMLPMEIRLLMPEVPADNDNAPAIAVAPAPLVRETMIVRRPQMSTAHAMVLSALLLVVTFLVAFAAGYCLA